MGTGKLIKGYKMSEVDVPEFLPFLSRGSHSSPKEGACIMEYISFLSGEKWSDSPQCTHPTLAGAARIVNDRLENDHRQQLLPLISRLMNTNLHLAEDDTFLGLNIILWCAKYAARFSERPWTQQAIAMAQQFLDWPPIGTKNLREFYEEVVTPDSYTEAATTVSSRPIVAILYLSKAVDTPTTKLSVEFLTRAQVNETVTILQEHNSDPVEFLSGLIDEFYRLTGRTEQATVSVEDLVRCYELTKKD